MDVERARRLRDREKGRARPASSFAQPGTRKQRELRFCKLRQWQIAEARAFLNQLPRLVVRDGRYDHTLTVEYEITDYTLQTLEDFLLAWGFHLENSLYCKLVRALIYFAEETQLNNLVQPERLLKKSHEVYSRAWEHHPHGDRDETPVELREEK